ncbi:MAG: hypothetical protein ACRD3C_01010 [Vicinamibacterales bacterium]
MAIDRNDRDERQARIDALIEQFRAAQQRRLVKRGLVLWKRAEAAQQAMTCVEPRPPEKVH